MRNILAALEADEEISSLEEEKIVIIEEIAKVLKIRKKDKLPALKDIPKKNLLEETAEVDQVQYRFKTHIITKTNELFYAGTVVVKNRLGVKIKKAAKRKEPKWRQRLQNKIRELRKENIKNQKQKIRKTLERKYSIIFKTLGVVIEELKQMIVAIAAKVRKYQEKVDRSRQSIMFQNNQRQFYRN